MKKVCIMLMMILFCLSTFGFEIPKQPNPPKLINDYIGLLQPDQVKNLEKKLVDFNNKTSIQITVVVLDDLDGEEASDVATEIGQKWGVGHKKVDNGIVFLIVKYNQSALEKLVTSKHGDYFIATGYGLEPYLTDFDVKSIGESNFIPHAKEDEYYEGITETVDAIIKDLGEIGWQQREEVEIQKKAEYAEAMHNLWNGVLIFLICAAILALLIFVFMKARKAYQKKQELKQRRESLQENFFEAKIDYEKLLSQIPTDIANYPSWAKEKHDEFMHTINRTMKDPAAGVIKDFPQNIDSNIVRASQILSILTNILPNLEDIVTNIKDISKEVSRYQEEAPQKVAVAKEALETFRISIQVLKDKGFKLPNYEKELSDFNVSFNVIQKNANTPTESKSVYESSEQIHKLIDSAKRKMDAHVSCRMQTIEEINQVSVTISTIPGRMVAAQKVLDQLKKEHPKQNWEDLDKTFSLVITLLEDCETLKKNAEEKNDMNTQDFEGAKNLITNATEKAESILACFTAIHNRKAEIVDAKQGFFNAVNNTEKMLQEAKLKLSDNEVESGAKRKLVEAENKLQEAKSKSSGNSIDWLVVIALLISANSLASESFAMANDNIEKAERRRKQKKDEDQRKKREEEKEEEDNNNSFYSSSNSLNSSNSPSSDIGSFGGFDGGSFGGGGAGGSW